MSSLNPSCTIPIPSSPRDPANSLLHLTEFRQADIDRLVSIFNSSTATEKIYPFVLTIPRPYSPADAQWWINFCQDRARKERAVLDFAIRSSNEDNDEILIGGISLKSDVPLLCSGHNLSSPPIKVEIGYWLDPTYWNCGIMSRSLETILKIAFEEIGVERVFGVCFVENAASAKVMEKVGFRYEGTLRSHARKEGKAKDEKMYSIIKDDWILRT